MTDTNPTTEMFSAADARRAVALLTHASRVDRPGIRAILEEAHDADAALDLAVAATALTLDLMPALRTPAGSELLAELATALAAAEAQP